MNQNYTDKWINIDEVADYLGIKIVTLRGCIKKIPLYQLIKLESSESLNV